MQYSRIHHWLIRTHWRTWVIPVVCSLPYFAAILWLLRVGLLWVAQLMLAPVLMSSLLVGLTYLLARLEFRSRWRSFGRR